MFFHKLLHRNFINGDKKRREKKNNYFGTEEYFKKFQIQIPSESLVFFCLFL